MQKLTSAPNLCSGSLLGGLIHPVQLLQTEVQGVFDVLHQLLYLEGDHITLEEVSKSLKHMTTYVELHKHIFCQCYDRMECFTRENIWSFSYFWNINLGAPVQRLNLNRDVLCSYSGSFVSLIKNVSKARRTRSTQPKKEAAFVDRGFPLWASQARSTPICVAWACKYGAGIMEVTE